MPNRTTKETKKTKVKIRIERFVGLVAMLLVCCAHAQYEPTWESLDSRPVPQWWRDAKFGIFVHWGPYAVPAFAPTDAKDFWLCYAEWYQGQCNRTNQEFCAHHEKFYWNAPYGNFAAAFKAENFDAAKWAALFKAAGARYAVLTTKHHDGYALWPSPESPYYNSVSMGSGRDLVGEFSSAMKAAGLRCGFYYSLMEYANGLYPSKVAGKPVFRPAALSVREWSTRMNLPQLKELVENYGADIIWPDGGWEWPSEDFQSREFLAWLYNESKVRNDVVVNDRWGDDCRGKHGGHLTSEYGTGGNDLKTKSGEFQRPWEECRGIGKSFGYNRYETADDYMTARACIELLVDVASRGGNLLLNVGPTADGRIPPIMEDRLRAMGRWLDKNGEAIYGTTRWQDADVGLKKDGVYFTRKNDSLYMICLKPQSGKLSIGMNRPVSSVSRLGEGDSPEWLEENGQLKLDFQRILDQDIQAGCVLRIAFR